MTPIIWPCTNCLKFYLHKFMNASLKILCLRNIRYWFDFNFLHRMDQWIAHCWNLLIVVVYWLMIECFSDIHRRTELIPLSRVILKKTLGLQSPQHLNYGLTSGAEIERWNRKVKFTIIVIIKCGMMSTLSDCKLF